MRRWWTSAGVLLGKYVQWVAVVVVAATVALGALGATRLDFATGQDSYLDDDDQIAVDNRTYQDLFGGQAMVTLWIADPGRSVLDLFTPANIAQLREVEATLRERGLYDGVISPLTALEWTEALVTPRDPDTGELRLDDAGNPVFTTPLDVTTSVASDILLGASERERARSDEEAAAARDADAEATLARLTAALDAGGATLENPAWAELLLVDNQGRIRNALRPFFPFAPGVEATLENATHAQMVVRLAGNLSIEEEGEDAVFVTETMNGREWEHFTTVTTGAPILLKDLNDYLQGGMATLGGIAVLVMAVVLSLVFRVRWRLLSLAVVLLAVIWAFSVLGLLDIPLAIVTISGLPILIGIGVDFAIQVHNRVEEEVVLDKELHPMSETLLELAPALLTATLAAVVAFLALQVSRVPMIRDFGVLLAIGIVCAFVLAIVVPTAVLGMREYRRPTTAAAPESVIERFVPRVGSLPPWTAVPFAVLSVVVLVAGVLLEDRFEIETDPEKWVNQDTQVIADLELLRERTGSSSELGLFLRADGGDVFSDEVGELAWDTATTELAQHEGALLTASGLATTVGYLMEVPGATALPPLGSDMRAAWDVAPPDIRRATVADDGRAANLVLRTGPSSLEQRKEVVDDIVADLEPRLADQPNVRATPSGLAVVGIGLLENLEANRAQLTYLALALVAVWLLVRLRGIGQALLAMVPVLLAVGVSSLVVALIGIELSPMTTVSGPLVAAAVTEFSVLILARYLEERRAGLGPLDASHHAAARTGRAFVASGLTTIGGFGVLVFSALPLLSDFGKIVTLNVTVALLVALVVLPPMLVFADRWLLPHVARSSPVAAPGPVSAVGADRRAPPPR